MKTKIQLSWLLMLISWLTVAQVMAQNYTFSRVAPCPQQTYTPATFSIGADIYVVGGVIAQAQSLPKVLTGDVWDYNTLTNTWTQKNNFPGTLVYDASGFAIGAYGYLANGWIADEEAPAVADTLWQYDPANDTWTTKEPYPGVARYSCSVFTLDSIAYMVAGFKPYENDVWAYDPSTDTWTQKASLPGAYRQAAVSFAIGNYGYAGLGATGDNLGGFYLNSDWYQYDPSSDTWTELNNFPGDPVAGAFVVNLNNEEYMINGSDENSLDYALGNGNQVWQYDAPSDTWSLWGVFPDSASAGGGWATVGGVGYFGLGAFNSTTYPITPDFWRFGPATGTTSCNANFQALFVTNAARNFQASGNFSPSALLSWNFGDGSSGYGTSVSHSYIDTGTYDVQLIVTDTANGGCGDTVIEAVDISNIATCSVASISSTSIGPDYTLIANATGDAPFTYLWTAVSDSGTIISTSPDPLVVIAPGQYVRYCVTITDSTGCSASDCTNFFNHDTLPHPPTYCATYLYIFPDTTGPLGEYNIYYYHIGGPIDTMIWSFGDGYFSYDSTPFHQYDTIGFYTVCLTIIDSDSCTSQYCDAYFYARSLPGGPMEYLQVLGSAAVTSGIKNVSSQFNVSVYPNPANDQLNISADGYKISEAFIYSADGRRVGAYEAPVNNRLYVGNLAAGVYFIQIKAGENMAQLKFVKTD